MIRLEVHLDCCHECRSFEPYASHEVNWRTRKYETVVRCVKSHGKCDKVHDIYLLPEVRKMMEEYINGNGKA